MTHVHSQHALASEDVLGLLSQQVPHEHVEAILVQRPARHDANTAHTTQVVQLLAAALGAALTLQGHHARDRDRWCNMNEPCCGVAKHVEMHPL